MNIALDVMGGDFAPKNTILGAKLALEELPEDSKLLLIGVEDQIKPLIQESNLPEGRYQLIHAPEVVGMAEHPTKAITQKPQSSIAISYGLLKQKKADAFCSAGNTGAVHVGAMFTIRAIEGIIRPALLGFVPKLDGRLGVIIDIGANADCKPDVLAQFAQIGSLYAEHVLNIPSPKVGLMNLGEEESKGTLLTQAAYQLIKLNESIRFVGNIEGRNLFDDKADVIVCDGFTGNVILKMAESIYETLSPRGISDDFVNQFNYEEIGGSPIVGVNGNVVIGHGVSTPLAIKNMILLGNKMAEANFYQVIKKAFAD